MNKPSARRPSRKSVSGLSLIGILLLLAIGYGVYAVVIKPGDKAGKRGTGGVAATARAAAPRVVIYTASSCDSCNRAKTWLTQRKVAFEERNVETSFEYEQELTNYKASIVPVIVVNDQPLYGFQSAHLDAALKQAAGPKK